jgi:Domain of unknown function (DUF4082)
MTSLTDLKIPLYHRVNGAPRAPTTSRPGNTTWLMARFNELIDQLIADFDSIVLESGEVDAAEVTALRNRILGAEQTLETLTAQFTALQGADAAQITRLDSLESTNSSQSQAISNQGQGIAAHAVQISALESEQQAQGQTISVLETAGAAVSAAINALHVGATDAGQRLEALEATNQLFRSEFENLNTRIDQLTQEVEALKGLDSKTQSLYGDETPTYELATGIFELGIRLSFEKSGVITALRHLKASEEIGAHVGRIWGPTGTLLASVNFSSETLIGWQTQKLETPFAVQSNTEYVISVNSNTAYPYVYAPVSGKSQGDLNAITAIYGETSVYPSSSFGDVDFFRDLEFCPDG